MATIRKALPPIALMLVGAALVFRLDRSDDPVSGAETALAVVAVALMVIWAMTAEPVRKVLGRQKTPRQTLVEVELANIAEEGERIAGDAFTADPDWDRVEYWTEASATFIGAVLGPAAKDRLTRVKGVPDRRGLVLDRVAAVREILDGLEPDQIKTGTRELRQRVAERHAAATGTADELGKKLRQAEVAPDDIDKLMREGIKLLGEIGKPMEPISQARGEVTYQIGPRDEHLDVAQGFDERARDLLIALRPALLLDYSDGANAFLEKDRKKAERREDKAPEGVPDAIKLREFVERIHLGPARYLEACLEGLGRARKALD